MSLIRFRHWLALTLLRLGWKLKPYTDHILYPGKFYKPDPTWRNPCVGGNIPKKNKR